MIFEEGAPDTTNLRWGIETILRRAIPNLTQGRIQSRTELSEAIVALEAYVQAVARNATVDATGQTLDDDYIDSLASEANVLLQTW